MPDTAPTTKLSPSVARGLPLTRKLDEGVGLLRQYRATGGSGSENDFAAVFAEIEEYDALLREYAGVALADATVFEIGFGVRLYRQVILQSMGVDVRGVDAEQPLVGSGPRAVAGMLRRNGLERSAKTFLRRALFDRHDDRALDRGLHARGLIRRLDPDRLVVADAAEVSVAGGSLDLVFSEDVFEHIEPHALERVVQRSAGWLRPGGLALIRPNIFTGIIGGHLLEWSRPAMRGGPRDRRSEPWEHLRRRRFTANTYLNELTRADYRTLLGRHFEILEERVTQPDLGREYYDQRARDELRAWSEEELFSNQTLFVLRPRPA